MNDPDLGNWTYAYDALGNLISQTDARGCVVALNYDGLSRLTGKVFSGACDSTPDITYTYDAYTAGSNYGRGYRTGMTDASGRRRRRLGRAAHLHLPSPRMDQYCCRDGQLRERYHLRCGWAGAQGRTLGNNLLSTDFTYFAWTTANGQGRLQKIVTSGESTTFQDLRNTYDAMGNVLTIQDYYAGNPQTQTFTPRLRSGQAYDAADRLTTAVASGGSRGNYPSETYSYRGTTGNLSNKAGISLSYNIQKLCNMEWRTPPHAVSAAPQAETPMIMTATAT